MDYNGGIYLLEVLLKEKTRIQVGRLGRFLFHPGHYYYCGSAQRYLKKRLKRHMRLHKAYHWHIDYLLEHSSITKIYTWPIEREGECNLAKLCGEAMESPVLGFGSSDCKCTSHLFYNKEEKLTRSKCVDGSDIMGTE